MDINAVNRSTDVATQAANNNDKNSLGKDDFLKLMVAQLKHQDPLDPVDTSQFITQTAQFSTLEQMINMNENIVALQAYQNTLTNSAAVTYIGQEVVARGNTIHHQYGQQSELAFSLNGDAAETYINVFDQEGNFVLAMEPGALAAGEHRLAWDGTDNAGNPVPEGEYTFTVDAVSADGQLIQAESQVQGLVSSVHYLGGKAYLMVGEQLVPLTAVSDVRQPEAEAEVE